MLSLHFLKEQERWCRTNHSSSLFKRGQHFLFTPTDPTSLIQQENKKRSKAHSYKERIALVKRVIHLFCSSCSSNKELLEPFALVALFKRATRVESKRTNSIIAKIKRGNSQPWVTSKNKPTRLAWGHTVKYSMIP